MAVGAGGGGGGGGGGWRWARGGGEGQGHNLTCLSGIFIPIGVHSKRVEETLFCN